MQIYKSNLINSNLNLINKNVTSFTIRQLLESGVHLGHRKSTWNKSIVPFLYGTRNFFCIFNLEKTVFLLKRALKFIQAVSQNRGKILFSAVSPSRSIQRFVFLTSKRAYQPCYVVSRWEGGILSNWKNIVARRYNTFMQSSKSSNKHLSKVQKRNIAKNEFFIESLKVNTLSFISKRSRTIKTSYPDGVFLINPLNNKYPILESFSTGTPLIGIVDSDNLYSNLYSFPIPANDDSFSSVRLITYLATLSCIKGIQHNRERLWVSLSKKRKK